MSIKFGNKAEDIAAEYIARRGYKIIDRNWRRPYCEIDIIAKRKKCIYFVEVKYRATTLQGRAIEYVTTTKLRSMEFAAECWISENDWGKEYTLSVVAVDGSFAVNDFIDSIF